MTSIESRIKTAEKELRFRIWVRMERVLKQLSTDELETIAASGRWPDRPEPAPGTSHLDTMDRKSLIKLWKKHNAEFEGRSRKEMGYFALHGHWPEQGDKTCMKSELLRKSRQSEMREEMG